MLKSVRRLVASAAAIAFVAAQPPATPAPKAVEPAQLPDPVKTADPLGVMLSDAKAAHAKLRDYTGVFTRQERVNGTLGAEQLAEIKVRTKPFSIALRFAKPQAVAGMEELYVSGTIGGKVKYRPAGAKGVSGFQLVSLDDPKILADTRHPVNEIGIAAMIERVTAIANREKTSGNGLEVYTAEFEFGGKKTTRYELLARRAHAHRYAHRVLVYVDKESKLPIRFEAYDAPKPGATAGELLEAYSYTNLKFNVGLGDSAFE